MENLRHGQHRTLRVAWDAKNGEDWRRAEEVYLPWPPEFPATDADPLGDGVAETLMLRDFATAVRRRTAPDQDVYFGVELSVTGIQAMRSSLAGSMPVQVPDLRRQASAELMRPTTGSRLAGPLTRRDRRVIPPPSATIQLPKGAKRRPGACA